MCNRRGHSPQSEIRRLFFVESFVWLVCILFTECVSFFIRPACNKRKNFCNQEELHGKETIIVQVRGNGRFSSMYF